MNPLEQKKSLFRLRIAIPVALVLLVAAVCLISSFSNPVERAVHLYAGYLLHRAKNPEQYDVPIANAVNRALLLSEAEYRTVPIISYVLTYLRRKPNRGYDPLWRVPSSAYQCVPSEGDIKSVALYSSCRYARWNGDNGLCGHVFVRRHCRAISVPDVVWQDLRLRSVVVEAALNPCRYLPSSAVVDAFRNIRSFDRSTSKRGEFVAESRQFHFDAETFSGCLKSDRSIYVRVHEVYIRVFSLNNGNVSIGRLYRFFKLKNGSIEGGLYKSYF